jgi:hypothetical protein
VKEFLLHHDHGALPSLYYNIISHFQNPPFCVYMSSSLSPPLQPQSPEKRSGLEVCMSCCCPSCACYAAPGRIKACLIWHSALLHHLTETLLFSPNAGIDYSMFFALLSALKQNIHGHLKCASAVLPAQCAEYVKLEVCLLMALSAEEKRFSAVPLIE